MPKKSSMMEPADTHSGPSLRRPSWAEGSASLFHAPPDRDKVRRILAAHRIQGVLSPARVQAFFGCMLGIHPIHEAARLAIQVPLRHPDVASFASMEEAARVEMLCRDLSKVTIDHQCALLEPPKGNGSGPTEALAYLDELDGANKLPGQNQFAPTPEASHGGISLLVAAQESVREAEKALLAAERSYKANEARLLTTSGEHERQTLAAELSGPNPNPN